MNVIKIDKKRSTLIHSCRLRDLCARAGGEIPAYANPTETVKTAQSCKLSKFDYNQL
jgi:hypothetical protein